MLVLSFSPVVSANIQLVNCLAKVRRLNGRNLRSVDRLLARFSQSLHSSFREGRLRLRSGREIRLLNSLVGFDSGGAHLWLQLEDLVRFHGVQVLNLGRGLGLRGGLARAGDDVLVRLGAVVVDIVADDFSRVGSASLGHLLHVDGLGVDDLLDGLDLLVDDGLVVHVDQRAHVRDGGTEEGEAPEGEEADERVSHERRKEGLYHQYWT